ncbi:late competence development ComFB family protein [Candidatus Riflebacteria bacterium]
MTPSRFEETYRTDWLVDLNRILIFQILDALFFSEQEGTLTPASEAEIVEINSDMPEEEFLKLDLEELASSEYFKNYCRCSSCMLDVAAVALNLAKPLYRISPEFNAFSTDENEQRKKLQSLVFRAMKIVEENPHH